MNSICSLAYYAFLCCAFCVGSCACGHSQVRPESSKTGLHWEFDLSGASTAYRRSCTMTELSGLPASLVFTVLENNNPVHTNVGVAVSFEIVEKNLALETLPVHTISFFPLDQTGSFSIRLKDQTTEVLRRMESRPEASASLVFALKSFNEKNNLEGLSLKCKVSGSN